MSKNINDYNRCLTKHPEKINAIADMYFNILRQNPDHQLVFPVAYIKEYLTAGKIVREGASKKMKDQAILMATNGFLSLEDQILIQDSSIEHLQTAFHYLKNEGIVEFSGRSCYKLTDLGKNINSVPPVPTEDGREAELITGKFVIDGQSFVDNTPTVVATPANIDKSVFVEVMDEKIKPMVTTTSAPASASTTVHAPAPIVTPHVPIVPPAPLPTVGIKSNILQKITEPLKAKIQDLKTKAQEMAKIIMSQRAIIEEKEAVIQKQDKIIKEREAVLQEFSDLPAWIKDLAEEVEGL